MGYYVALAATVGFGGLSTLVAVFVTVQRVQLLTRGLRGTGTIVDAFVSSTPMRSKAGTEPVSPVIEVVDASTGATFRFRSWFGSSVTDATIGTQVPVRYLAGDPDMAEIDRFTSMWAPPALFALAGVVLLVSGWLVWTGVAVT